MLVKPSKLWLNLVKLGQTCYKLVLFGAGHYNLPPIKEKFRPRNSYLCYGRDEDTGSAFGLPAPKSLPQLGGFSKGLSLRI